MPDNVSVTPPVTASSITSPPSSSTSPPSSPTSPLSSPASSSSSPPSPPSMPAQGPPGQYVFIKVINILFLFFHS